MHQTIRSLPKFAFVAFVFAGSLLTALAQPSASPAPSFPQPSPASGPIPGPAFGGGPKISPSGLPAPMLQGIISDDEFKQYTAFQQQINEDPAIKDINAKIAKLSKELQQLRAEANATREKLVAANPEIKKIQDKITTALHARTSNGPMPMPMPMPAPQRIN